MEIRIYGFPYALATGRDKRCRSVAGGAAFRLGHSRFGGRVIAQLVDRPTRPHHQLAPAVRAKPAQFLLRTGGAKRAFE